MFLTVEINGSGYCEIARSQNEAIEENKDCFGSGHLFVSLGLLLMYDSGFLLHPSGYVVCSGQCYYYEYVYPIKRIEFWIGLFMSAASIFALGLAVFFERASSQ